MFRTITTRLLGTIPVLLGIVFVTMLTLDLIPGDPVAMMLGDNARPEEVAALREYLGLDQPLIVRYGRYLFDIAQGDLGRSILSKRPVWDEIATVLPRTLQLAVVAMVLAVILGIGTGILSALRPGGLLDVAMRLLALVGLSMPVFWLGLVLIYVFAYYFRLFPVGGAGSWRHLVLPALALAAPSVAIVSRMTRSSMLEVLREDYIRTAWAKGLRQRLVVVRHTLRNALIPIVTVVGLQFGQLMGGAVLTETVFAWPGLGRLIVQAIFARLCIAAGRRVGLCVEFCADQCVCGYLTRILIQGHGQGSQCTKPFSPISTALSASGPQPRIPTLNAVRLPGGAIKRVAFAPDLLLPTITGKFTDDAWRQQIVEHLAQAYPTLDVRGRWQSGQSRVERSITQCLTCCVGCVVIVQSVWSPTPLPVCPRIWRSWAFSTSLTTSLIHRRWVGQNQRRRFFRLRCVQLMYRPQPRFLWMTRWKMLRQPRLWGWPATTTNLTHTLSKR
ncbi:MAG: ABC transporter permease [Caldilineaceae bacterium]